MEQLLVRGAGSDNIKSTQGNIARVLIGISLKDHSGSA